MTTNLPKFCVIHCSDVSQKTIFDQFQSINTYHRDTRGFPMSSLGLYVGYHYLVTGFKVYQCRLDTDEGAHCNQGFDGTTVYQPENLPWPVGVHTMNLQSIGICWGGDGDTEYPLSVHYNLLQKKVWDIQDKYNIPNEHIFFHRKFNLAKTCPGSLLTTDWLQKFLTRPVPIQNPKPVDQCEKQNGIIAAQASQIANQQSTISFFQKLVQALKALLP